MPRQVDHDDRRREIVDATVRVLAARGVRGLTFRAVAEEMGGSSTLVTHYFPTRQALLDALAESVAWLPEEVFVLESGTDDPRRRLRIFLQWWLPRDEPDRRAEQARINLIGERDTRMRTQHFFDAWDARMREMLRDHLKDLLPASDIPATVDLLRTVTNGISLSTVEHPEEWPASRQFAVLDHALRLLGLAGRCNVQGAPPVADGQVPP
jgi:AcrR family transcriptional regulator